MRKLINIMILALVPAFASAQRGGVEVEVKELEKRGNELHVSLDIKNNPNVFHRSDSYIITPVLKGDDNRSATLKPVVVNGSRKSKMWRRSEKLSGPMAPGVPVIQKANRGEGNTLQYKSIVQFEKWMLTSELFIDEKVVSCANRTSSDELYDTGSELRLQVPPVYEIITVIDFVVPEKEQVKRRDIQSKSFLDFPVGKAAILPGFRKNPVELEKINRTLASITQNKDVQVTSMFIEGFASPDGTTAINERLSVERAAALMKYIKERYNISGDIVKSAGGGEDWKLLRSMVAESDLAQKQEILNIIDSNDHPDTKTMKLKGLAGGKVYRTLLADYFPALRRVDYRVDFNVRAYQDNEIAEVYRRDPSMLSSYEFYMLAEQTPNPAQRDEIMAIAERMEPDNPAVIANAIARHSLAGHAEEANKWVIRGSKVPEAFNNIGVVYILRGDYGMAENYLKQAAAAGSNEAIQNLQQIENKRRNEAERQHYLNLLDE